MNRISHASRRIANARQVDNRQHLDTEDDMIDGLDRMMQFQSDALKLRSYRQELLSANIANSDTPNYKAVDFDFASALKSARTAGSGNGTGSVPDLQYRVPAQFSLDGNSVEMDAERAKFAENTIRYEAAMRTLTAQIKTMLAAVQG
jgi:flagellar basal-body rod protein FlgB